MKRFVASVLSVCIMLSPIPISARQSATLAITSLDRGSLKPFQKLTIRGSGFDPAGAISVVFTPRARGSKVSVPAFAATTTAIEVIVPPIPDTTNGFGFGATDVQVVQVTATAVSSSNVQTGFDIQPMRSVSSRGSLLRGYLRALRPVLEQAKTGSRASDATRAAVDAYLQSQTELLEKVERIVNDASYATTLTTGDNSQLVLDARALQYTDQLLMAFMEGTQTFTPTSARASVRRQDLPPCDPGYEEQIYNDLICTVTQGILHESTPWIGAGLVVAGGLVVAVAGTMQVALIALTASVVAIGLALIAAHFIVASAIGATAGGAASIDNGLPFSESVRDQGQKLLDTAREYGAAVPQLADRAMGVFATTAHAAGVPSGGPQGGLPINLPGQETSSGQTVMTITGSGNSATVQRYTAPLTQGTRALADARQAAPVASRYDGSYSGTVNWFASDGEDSLTGSLGLSMTVSGGRVTVTAPVGGSGTVSANGGASGSAGGFGFTCTWSGSFSAAAATGPASGGGVFSCTDSEGRAWGGWSGSRR